MKKRLLLILPLILSLCLYGCGGGETHSEDDGHDHGDGAKHADHKDGDTHSDEDGHDHAKDGDEHGHATPEVKEPSSAAAAFELLANAAKDLAAAKGEDVDGAAAQYEATAQAAAHFFEHHGGDISDAGTGAILKGAAVSLEKIGTSIHAAAHTGKTEDMASALEKAEKVLTQIKELIPADKLNTVIEHNH